MAPLPHRPQLERMIAQAMKDLAPELYRELRKEGALVSAIRERADAAEEIYEIEMSGRYEILQKNDDFLATVQALTALRSRASEAAIAMATEF